MRALAFLMALLAAVLPWAALAATVPPCFDSRAALSAWLNTQPGNVSHQSLTLMKRLPANTSIDLLVDVPFNEARAFQGFVDWRQDSPVNPNSAWLPSSAIWAIRIPDSHPFLTENKWATGKTLLSFMLPASFSSVGREVTFNLAACVPAAEGGPPQPEFALRLNAPTSAQWFSIALAAGITSLSYLAIALANLSFGPKSRMQPSGHKPFTLDPVALTAGWDGRGSPAKLQVLFFSLIIIGLLTYILSRAGLLSDLSQSVLTLLGISSVGALAAHGTDLSKNRLDYRNWAWLVRKGWLTIAGIAGERSPRWSDLFTTQGEFDVSRFQLIFFSLVVGVALLQIGLTDLATFTVPQALLELMGLSQVTYILGKAVGPNDVSALNKAIEELRSCEDNFVLKAGVQPDPAPKPPNGPGPPPPDFDSAKRRAGPEYDLYVLKEQEMRTMFEATYGIPLTPLIPRFL